MLAPGAHIVAPLAMGSAFQTLCPSCVVAGEYLRIGGTSMAAPVVAGAAALLLQARPDLNPDQIKGLLTANTNVARTGLGLGTAESFAVLAGTTVTNTGPSTITGNLGLSPGTAVTGFGPGTVTGTTYAADAIALKAQSDLTIAYDDAAARTPAVSAPADLGGLTLTPGVYSNASSLGLTGTLTLDAQGDPNAVFVFQAGSTLTTASASQVRLVNGAQACNVFWKVGSSATLGTGTVLAGNILALTSISINDGVTLHGRALARNGAVTLINDTITAAHCAIGAGGSVPASELDVAAALAAEPGIGANQHLWPNRAVEAALVQARLDPTRANWTKGTWTKGTWTKGTWSKGTWSKGTWEANARRRSAVADGTTRGRPEAVVRHLLKIREADDRDGHSCSSPKLNSIEPVWWLNALIGTAAVGAVPRLDPPPRSDPGRRCRLVVGARHHGVRHRALAGRAGVPAQLALVLADRRPADARADLHERHARLRRRHGRRARRAAAAPGAGGQVRLQPRAVRARDLRADRRSCIWPPPPTRASAGSRGAPCSPRRRSGAC